MPANNVPNDPHFPHNPVDPDVPGGPNPPVDPDAPPTGPEPSVDTTKREAPGPATQGPLKLDAKAPKMPHERDQSVDMTHGEPDAQMQQAYKDVKRGLKDTDEGLRASHVEQRHQAS